MIFAKRTFTWAAIYGVIVLTPTLFLEGAIARATGPITYPEYYYGFAGAALVCQLMLVVIGRDPVRYRALMPVGILEKLSFGAPCLGLYALHRLVNHLVNNNNNTCSMSRRPEALQQSTDSSTNRPPRRH